MVFFMSCEFISKDYQKLQGFFVCLFVRFFFLPDILSRSYKNSQWSSFKHKVSTSQHSHPLQLYRPVQMDDQQLLALQPLLSAQPLAIYVCNFLILLQFPLKSTLIVSHTPTAQHSNTLYVHCSIVWPKQTPSTFTTPITLSTPTYTHTNVHVHVTNALTNKVKECRHS